MFIDTHCHLTEWPEQDVASLLRDAHGAGVRTLITVGTNENTSLQNVILAESHTSVFASIGFFPTERPSEDAWETVSAQATHPRVVAIGEAGFDFQHAARTEEEYERQATLFRRQIHLAAQYDLPLIIHTRNAFSETIALLSEGKEEFPHLRGVVHCWSGTWEETAQILDIGFLISFTAQVTYPAYTAPFTNIIPRLPHQSLMIETDSPFLPPAPSKIRPNTPKNVTIVGETIARMRNCSIEQIAEQTTQNASTLFRFTKAR